MVQNLKILIIWYKKVPRFDIQALDLSTQSKQSVAQAQKSGYYPTITLDNTFNYYDNNYDRKIIDTDINNHQNVASANMKWNLFFWSNKISIWIKNKRVFS